MEVLLRNRRTTSSDPEGALDSALVSFSTSSSSLPLAGTAAPSNILQKSGPLFGVKSSEQLIKDQIRNLERKGSDGCSREKRDGGGGEGAELELEGVGSDANGEESEEDLGLMVGYVALGGCEVKGRRVSFELNPGGGKEERRTEEKRDGVDWRGGIKEELISSGALIESGSKRVEILSPWTPQTSDTVEPTDMVAKEGRRRRWVWRERRVSSRELVFGELVSFFPPFLSSIHINLNRRTSLVLPHTFP